MQAGVRVVVRIFVDVNYFQPGLNMSTQSSKGFSTSFYLRAVNQDPSPGLGLELTTSSVGLDLPSTVHWCGRVLAHSVCHLSCRQTQLSLSNKAQLKPLDLFVFVSVSQCPAQPV